MLQTEYKFGKVNNLARQIASSDDKVNFKGIFSNANGGVSLLAFKAGQKLDEHIAPAQVMVSVIEGEIELTMIDVPHIVKSGEFILMGAGVPHSVVAKADSKVLLFKVKP